MAGLGLFIKLKPVYQTVCLILVCKEFVIFKFGSSVTANLINDRVCVVTTRVSLSMSTLSFVPLINSMLRSWRLYEIDRATLQLVGVSVVFFLTYFIFIWRVNLRIYEIGQGSGVRMNVTVTAGGRTNCRAQSQVSASWRFQALSFRF